MKSKLAISIGALFIGLGLSAGAQALDADAIQAMLKKQDCTKCHALDKEKKGPSYKKVAAKYKGKADAEEKITKNLTTTPKVKLSDGTEEDHKKLETKDPKDMKAVIQWILAQ